ncbi:MAG: MarR family EPS-associated transcriptional regulator [Limnobacter sp.]|nr:MarR family EPS-associated transcriptional regulator [Limnobacter sp.]
MPADCYTAGGSLPDCFNRQRRSTQLINKTINSNINQDSQAQAPSRQSKIQEDTYFRVMRLLEANPDLTQRELAERLGVSVGGLNYCLKALMEKGLVKMQNFSQSKNKFGYVYVLTPRGIAEKAALTGKFLKRKMEEYEALRVEIEALKNEAILTNMTSAENLDTIKHTES